MRRWTRIVSLGVAGLFLWACTAPVSSLGEVIVRHQFAGLDAVARRTDVGALPKILSLRESGRILDDLAWKLGADFPRWCGATHAAGTNHATAFQPVLRQVLRAPSRLEVRADAGAVTGWALALRLETAEADRLGSELVRLMPGLLFGTNPPTFKVGPEWALAGPEGKGSLRYGRVNGWAVMGSGKGAFEALRQEVAGKDVESAVAGGKLWTAELDLARLAKLLDLRAEPPGPVSQWPRVKLGLECRNGRLRTLAEFEFAKPLGLTMDEWVLPNDVLRDPLVGFTAVRGADQWLSRLGFLADLGVREWPKQLFLWSMAGPPWLQFISAPIQAPTNLMAQVSLTLPVRFVTNTMWQGQMFSLRVTNQATRVELRGLPYFQPFLDAHLEGTNETVYGGLFPVSLRRLPAPDGLLEQVRGRTNLVAYDWETTGNVVITTNRQSNGAISVETNQIGRLIQFKELYQFGILMLNKSGGLLPTDSEGTLRTPGADWITAAAPYLGDTITEVVQSGPSRLSLTRSSQVGMNAFELTYLLRWLANAGFPGWVEPAPLPRRAPPDKRADGGPAEPVAPGAPATSPQAR